MEYNTEHIRMQANAAIEDLLRRLPGLQIDADGTISYNGTKIDHLLLDGEEMMGAGPAVITRNFDADKIAKVQILDRKSDQARLTGVDDGIRMKTLNLVLKESAKDGYFGKVETGGNAEGYYDINGALAALRAKEQFTAVGLATNTGGGGNSVGVNFHNDNPDAMAALAGTGIPRLDAIALHYANRWNTPEDHFQANYQFSHYYTQPLTNSTTLQIQPGSIYVQDQLSQSVNQQDEHWFYGTYEWPISPISGFMASLQATDAKSMNELFMTGRGSFNDTLTNSSFRKVNDEANKRNLAGNIIGHAQLGKRASRVFSLGGYLAGMNTATNGYIYSINQFFQPDASVLTRDTVDQRKHISDRTVTGGGSLSFNEPLWKDYSLVLGYNIIYSGSKPLQATYDREDGKYLNLVDSLSKSLQVLTLGHRITTNLEGRNGAFGYAIGSDWVDYNFIEHDLIKDSSSRMHYASFNPRILINYNPVPNTFMHFEYIGSAQNPSVSQLNPTTNNNDPLHVFIGNPDLRPQIKQELQYMLRMAKKWLINLTINGGMVRNAITTKTTIDSSGKQTSELVNVNGNKTAQVNLSVTRKMLGVDLGWYLSESYGRTMEYINSDLDQNDANTVGGGLSISRYVEDKYSMQIATNFAYFDQRSSVNIGAPIHYWSQRHQGSLSLFFIKGYEINTNASYTWQEKTNAFAASTSVLLWNAYVGRNLLHNKLVAKFQLNNILNVNAGITRTNSGNINTQSSTNILGRYWMLSAIYHFDCKFGKK